LKAGIERHSRGGVVASPAEYFSGESPKKKNSDLENLSNRTPNPESKEIIVRHPNNALLAHNCT
jgi:hypothetical protein